MRLSLFYLFRPESRLHAFILNAFAGWRWKYPLVYIVSRSHAVLVLARPSLHACRLPLLLASGLFEESLPIRHSHLRFGRDHLRCPLSGDIVTRYVNSGAGKTDFRYGLRWTVGIGKDDDVLRQPRHIWMATTSYSQESVAKWLEWLRLGWGIRDRIWWILMF